jgi:glucosamine-6-phosphate deaminase
MNKIIVKDAEELSAKAAALIVEQLKSKPASVLALPTGKTPQLMYDQLAAAHELGEVSFAQARIFNLDEYIGLARTSADSFYVYMRRHLFDRVDVRPENIWLLDGAAGNLADECANYERHIKELGGLDLAVLGIGRDGHIGFCEPGTSFESHTFVADLTESTRQANADDLIELKQTPTRAITIGLATIFAARQILLLASGAHKAEIINQALNGPVSEQVPASILQTHPATTVILDEAAAGQ